MRRLLVALLCFLFVGCGAAVQNAGSPRNMFEKPKTDKASIDAFSKLLPGEWLTQCTVSETHSLQERYNLLAGGTGQSEATTYVASDCSGESSTEPAVGFTYSVDAVYGTANSAGDLIWKVVNPKELALVTANFRTQISGTRVEMKMLSGSYLFHGQAVAFDRDVIDRMPTIVANKTKALIRE